jgi:hypothetical protein
MSILDDLLNCVTYKAIYFFDTRSAYIWRNGACSYYCDLTEDQVDLLKEIAKQATRKFSIKGAAFGFTS